MRPRIKKHKLPVLVYTTSKDKEMQELAAYNRKQDEKKYGIKYLMCIFGKEKQITKEEYEDALAMGLKVKMIKL